MKYNFLDFFNDFWNWIVGAFALTTIRTKLGRWAFRKIVDYSARPIYDYLIRKGYIKLKTISAKKAEDDLKNAKKDIDTSVDMLP